MKIVDLTCPHCGANLKVDSSATEYTCEYCGSKVLLDNGGASKQTVDNAEESGYQFEKGRIRAQREAARQYQSNSGNNQTQQPKKKSKTWLWVLGWIFIFPVPLTILMLRKKDMKPSIKYGIIAVAWIFYLLFGLSGNNNQAGTTDVAAPSAEPTIQNTENEETGSSTVQSATSDGADVSKVIVLVAGEQGDYGELITLNAGTEFEETYYVYRLPAGTYKVKNTGNYTGQFNVYGDTPEKEGEWEVLPMVGIEPILLDVGAESTVTISEHQVIEIHEPDIFQLALIS